MIRSRSARHRAARSALDSARLLRTLIDNIPAMINYWDTSMRNVLANDAYVDWFGMSPDEMTGMHVREVLGEELFAENSPYIEAALKP